MVAVIFSLWAIGALAFFGFLVWALAETNPDSSEWLTAVILSLLWPYSVVSLGRRLYRERSR